MCWPSFGSLSAINVLGLQFYFTKMFSNFNFIKHDVVVVTANLIFLIAQLPQNSGARQTN